MRAALWNFLLLLSWGLLFAPVLKWLWRALPQSPHHLLGTHHLNLLILIAGAAVGLYKLWRAPSILKRQPRLSLFPLSLMLSGLLGFLLIERFWDISLLSGLCFFVGSYGLVGLFIDEATFKRHLPLAGLLALALPFGDRAEAYLGLPARMFAAQVVNQALASLDIATLQTQSIILLENGIANVDAPCSGLKSLWTGSVFLMGATVLEKRSLDLRWLLAGTALLCGLVAANVVRVALIVLVGIVGDAPSMAEVIHEPLGIVGFVLSCGLAYVILRRKEPALQAPAPRAQRSPYLAPALCGLTLLGAALYTPRPKPKGAGQRFSVTLPAQLNPKPLGLSFAEKDLVQRFGAGRAIKRRFDLQGVTGSVLISYSPSWRAHHPPELCLTSIGTRVKAIQTRPLGAGSIRRLELSDGRTAFYWYQSPSQTTPDMLTRISSDLSGAQRRWVLVSMLLDQAASDDPSLLLETIHRAVHQALEAL